MIVDAIILVLAGVLIVGGMWLLWSTTSAALEDWRADR